jgi:hypothetical protein
MAAASVRRRALQAFAQHRYAAGKDHKPDCAIVVAHLHHPITVLVELVDAKSVDQVLCVPIGRMESAQLNSLRVPHRIGWQDKMEVCPVLPFAETECRVPQTPSVTLA